MITGLRAASVAGQPRLNWNRAGNNLVLFWDNSECVLESADSLTPPVEWVEVTPPPAIVNGYNTITVNTSTGSRFFRLRLEIETATVRTLNFQGNSSGTAETIIDAF